MPFASKHRRSVKLEFKLPTRTKASHAAEHDINEIMKKYRYRDLHAFGQLQPKWYADVSGVPDYKEAILLVKEGEAMFAKLPSVIRTQFDNDATAFLDFVGKPENRDKLVEWGMIDTPPPEPGPIRVEVVNPTSEPPKN